MENKHATLRLNKFIASSGICTRKEAVEKIKNGMVTVNNAICCEPFYELSQNDLVYYKGKQVLPQKLYSYFLVNKPKNVGESNNEINNKPSLQQLVKVKTFALLKQIFPLADGSCGLTILTDDDALINKYQSNDIKYNSVFELHLLNPIEMEDLNTLQKEAQIKAPFIKGITHIAGQSTNQLGVVMSGGSEKLLNTFFTDQQLTITKCDRTSIKGLNKKDLKRGWYRPLLPKEIIFLRHFT